MSNTPSSQTTPPKGRAPCEVVVQYATSLTDPYEEAVRQARIRELKIRADESCPDDLKEYAKEHRKAAEGEAFDARGESVGTTPGTQRDAVRRLPALVDLETGVMTFPPLEAEEFKRLVNDCHVHGMAARFLLKDGPWEVDLIGFEQRYRNSQKDVSGAESAIEIRVDLGQSGDIWEEAAWERWQQMAEEIGTTTLASQAEGRAASRPRLR